MFCEEIIKKGGSHVVYSHGNFISNLPHVFYKNKENVKYCDILSVRYCCLSIYGYTGQNGSAGKIFSDEPIIDGFAELAFGDARHIGFDEEICAEKFDENLKEILD
jgi:hypothetical protein